MKTRSITFWCLLALLWGVGVAALLVPILDRKTEVVTPDGVSYIDSAANLLAGHGLRHIAWDLSSEQQVPLTLWPPGYPILIAGISWATGASTTAAAIWIARVGWALIPLGSVLVFASLRRPGAGGVGFVVGALVQLSPGALFAPRVQPDAMFLLLAMSSLVCWSHAIEGRGRWLGWALGSGVAAGCAYALRNVGISLLVAMPAAAMAASVLTGTSREHLRAAIGFALGAVPLVVALKVRNLTTFGVLEPYTMATSTRSLASNCLDALGAIVRNITAGGEPAERWLVGKTIVLVGVTLPLMLVAGALILRMVLRARADRARAAVLVSLLAYIGAGLGVVIVARTRYEWGEQVNPRYVFQYTWLISGIVLIAALEWLESRPRTMVMFKYGAAAILLGLAVLHLRPWVMPSKRSMQFPRVLADAGLRQVLDKHTPSHLVLSDRNTELNQIGPPRAFHVPLGESSLDKIIASIPSNRRDRPVLIVVVKVLTTNWEQVAAEADADPLFKRAAETDTAIAYTLDWKNAKP